MKLTPAQIAHLEFAFGGFDSEPLRRAQAR